MQDEDYGYLLIHFKTIAKILTDKLKVLDDLSFDASLAYLFGFSFGARLITKAAFDFGPKQIGNIDRKNTFIGETFANLFIFFLIFQFNLFNILIVAFNYWFVLINKSIDVQMSSELPGLSVVDVNMDFHLDLWFIRASVMETWLQISNQLMHAFSWVFD